MRQNILSYMGLSVWHCTPDHFKEIRNMKMFREKGKNDQYLLRNCKNLKELIEFKILKITIKQLSYPIVQTNIFFSILRKDYYEKSQNSVFNFALLVILSL